MIFPEFIDAPSLRWTQAEKALLAQHNYGATTQDRRILLRKLPHRTKKAIQSKCRELSGRTRCGGWTAAEVAILRNLCAGEVERSAALTALPTRSFGAIRQKANNLGLSFICPGKPGRKPTCFWTVAELGLLARLLRDPKIFRQSDLVPFFPGRTESELRVKLYYLRKEDPEAWPFWRKILPQRAKKDIAVRPRAANGTFSEAPSP